MENKLTVFSEKLQQEIEVCLDTPVEEQASDWSCWVDAGWGNG